MVRVISFADLPEAVVVIAAGDSVLSIRWSALTTVTEPGSEVRAAGRAYEVLRETRMAAVVCAVGAGDAGALARTMARSTEIGIAIAGGIRRCFDEPAVAEPDD